MKKLLSILPFTVFPVAAGALTAEDLAGTWCYSHYEAGGEREDQNITYVFNSDGTLQYNNTPGASTDKPGTYSIDGDGMEIEPTFAVFNLTVKSQEEDRFVLDGLGKHVFVRGECQ